MDRTEIFEGSGKNGSLKGLHVEAKNPSFRPGNRILLWVVLTLSWLGIVLGGTALLLWHSNSPGIAGFPPERWPIKSSISPDKSLPTFIMFVHPQCPCSEASIGELALLMAHCQGRVRTHVMFLASSALSANWAQSQKWRLAEIIPGVTVHRDLDGQEARLFQAETSGETVLYDSWGRLLFHGGITICRGHSGDNPGRTAAMSLLLGLPTDVKSTPVFGCALF